MNFESQLEEDKRIAFEKSYTFSVEVQEGKGLPWNEQENKIEAQENRIEKLEKLIEELLNK